MVPELIIVLNGDIASQGGGKKAASVGNAVVRMLEQDTDSFQLQGFFKSSVIHFPDDLRTELKPSPAASERAFERRFRNKLMETQDLKEGWFKYEPPFKYLFYPAHHDQLIVFM